MSSTLNTKYASFVDVWRRGREGCIQCNAWLGLCNVATNNRGIELEEVNCCDIPLCQKTAKDFRRKEVGGWFAVIADIQRRR